MRRLKQVLVSQLTQGASPRGLALSCAVAFVLSLFPLLGTTTILCLAAGLLFKLNHPTMQAVNYFLAPLQLVLIPVFLSMGQSILNVPHVSIRPEEMISLFRQDWIQFMIDYGEAGGHAIFAWLIVTPFVGALLFPLFHRLFLKLASKGVS